MLLGIKNDVEALASDCRCFLLFCARTLLSILGYFVCLFFIFLLVSLKLGVES